MEKDAKKNVGIEENGTNQNNVNAKNENLQKIDIIKNLIFGENMEEYDHKFHDLFDQLKEYHSELEERMLNVNKKIADDIKSLSEKFENRTLQLEMEFAEKMTKLQNNKSDRRELGDMLQVISEKLKK